MKDSGGIDANGESPDLQQSLHELAKIIARGVRRHLQKSDARLESRASGWLPSAPDVDIANAVNAFQSK